MGAKSVALAALYCISLITPNYGLSLQQAQSIVNGSATSDSAKPSASTVTLPNGTVVLADQNSTTTSCSNLMQNMSVSCWDELSIPGYLNKWWKSNGQACQMAQLDFAGCYQQNLGITQQTCNSMGPSGCDFPINFSKGNYTPQQAYVLYAIFAIWQWFNSLYTAIANADVSATGPVASIVSLINPIKQAKKPLGDILTALTAIAPAIAVPAQSAWGIFKASTIGEAILRQSPNVAKTLNPVGTLASQWTDFADISSGLATVKNTYQQNVSQALQLIQDDIDNFQVFTEDGRFIAPKPDLQFQSKNLTNSLQTYITSASLTSANIIITMTRDTNPAELKNNGSVEDTNILNGCDGNYDEHGLCGEWWWDSTTNIAYGLTSLDDPGKSYHKTLETLFSNGWTTGNDLFRGARDCADWVASGKNNTPTLDTVTMTPRCISNTQVCVFKQDCKLNDASCLYTGEYGGSDKLCKPSKDFNNKGCKGNGDGTFITYNAPNSYIGPIMFDAQFSDILCIA